MADFASTAFPWIALGIAVAIILSYMNSKEKRQDNKQQ